MLKFLKTSTSAKPFKVLRDFTTQIKPKNPSTYTPKEDTLYYKLLPLGDPSISVVPVLDQWVSQGNTVVKYEFRKIIKQFRNYRRFKHALEVSECMGNTKHLEPAPGDIAIHLDLISKVHGVEQAESYFNTIPESFRVFEVYGALLNCYTDSKSLEKAENLMQKMRELDYCKVLNYNVMLNLYSHMGKIDKLDSLMKEMEEKGINRDKYSFNIRLKVYAEASDISEMEKLLMKMEASSHIDWITYVIAAKGYLKAGETEKASEVLKKSEQLIRGNIVNSGLQVLLTLYASAGKKRDVYRIWNLLKKFGKFRNTNYLSMITSLEKLDDLEGAEKILEEWLVNKKYFDVRIINFFVSAYCKRGHLEKAESLIKRLVVDCGFKPNASTWYRMARGYCNDKEDKEDKEKALEMIKKAIDMSDRLVKIDFCALASCVEYLKEKGDIDKAEELLQALEDRGPFSVDIRENVMVYLKDCSLASKELGSLEGETKV